MSEKSQSKKAGLKDLEAYFAGFELPPCPSAEVTYDQLFVFINVYQEWAAKQAVSFEKFTKSPKGHPFLVLTKEDFSKQSILQHSSQILSLREIYEKLSTIDALRSKHDIEKCMNCLLLIFNIWANIMLPILLSTSGKYGNESLSGACGLIGSLDETKMTESSDLLGL